jgi:superfamily I DNA and/or RNA helicase
LLDERRLNVALTRPKFFLIIVGNAKTLSKSLVWEDMVEYCKAQGSYVKVKDYSYYETINGFKKNVLPQFETGE